MLMQESLSCFVEDYSGGRTNMVCWCKPIEEILLEYNFNKQRKKLLGNEL